MGKISLLIHFPPFMYGTCVIMLCRYEATRTGTADASCCILNLAQFGCEVRLARQKLGLAGFLCRSADLPANFRNFDRLLSLSFFALDKKEQPCLVTEIYQALKIPSGKCAGFSFSHICPHCSHKLIYYGLYSYM